MVIMVNELLIFHSVPMLTSSNEWWVFFMSDISLFGLIVITGFIAAGFFNSIYQLLTNKVLSFDISKQSGIGMLVSIITLIFTGPFILIRNSIRAFRIENRHVGWVAASTAISVFWSFVSGLFLLNIYLTTML